MASVPKRSLTPLPVKRVLAQPNGVSKHHPSVNDHGPLLCSLVSLARAPGSDNIWQVGRRLVEAVLGLNAARVCALATAPCTCGATSGDIPSPCSSQPAPARGDVRTPSSGWVGRRHGSQGLGMRRVELLRPSRGVGCVDTPQGAPCHRERSSSRRHKGAASMHMMGWVYDTSSGLRWGTYENARRARNASPCHPHH